jgi:hypothetical protein
MTGDANKQSTRGSRLWVLLTILATLLITLTCLYLYGQTVPIQAWLGSESLTDVPTDHKIEEMVKAAIRDHYLKPMNGMPRKLIFLRAATVPPNDVYLIFWPAGVADTTIRYRGDRDSGRLYWKTAVSE